MQNDTSNNEFKENSDIENQANLTEKELKEVELREIAKKRLNEQLDKEIQGNIFLKKVEPVPRQNETNRGTIKKVTIDKNKKDTETQIDGFVEMYDYKYVEKFILKDYYDTQTNNSSIIDIIGVYVKGQKILYTEAKTLCEQRLSSLMIPSILFTVVSSILNLILKDSTYGNYITSGLNGAIAFILAVINYLKLDARAEAHRSSAYKYDKLLSYIQFQSGKQLFFKEENNKMGEIISRIEKDVTEIKETNQFVLPEKIRYKFPLLSGTNIFTVVKEITLKETNLINELVKTLNQIYELRTFISSNETNVNYIIEHKANDEFFTPKEELSFLIRKKYDLISKIIDLQKEYTDIDDDFEKELKKYSQRSNFRLRILDWLKV